MAEFSLLTKVRNITHKSPDGSYTIGEVGSSTIPYLHSGCLAIKADGVTTFMRLIQAHYPQTGLSSGLDNSGDSSTTGSNEFNGGLSYERAMDTFTNNPSKVRSFTEADLVLDGGDSAGIGIVHDVTGETINMGRFMDGDPDCMASLTNGTPRAKRVRFLIDSGYAARVNASVVTECQKRTLRLIDWLESRQIRTSLTLISSLNTVHAEITAKHYHEPVNLNDIAVVAHPAYFRRLIFRAIEHSKTFEYGYGTAGDLTRLAISKPALFTSDDLNELTVFIGSKYYGLQSLTSDFDQLEQTLQTRLQDDNYDNSPLSVLT
jgi:hypothetical protein